MAGKTKDMSQIKQLLLLHQQGKGIKEIARTLGMSKNTVKSYLKKLSGLQPEAADSVAIDALLKLEAPTLEAKFHAGNPAYKQEAERYAALQERMPYLGYSKSDGRLCYALQHNGGPRPTRKAPR